MKDETTVQTLETAVPVTEASASKNEAASPQEVPKAPFACFSFDNVNEDGKYYDEKSGSLKGDKYCSGGVYGYTVYVPKFEKVPEYALIVTFDGLNKKLAQVMADLYEDGIAPPTVVLGIGTGTFNATLPGGTHLNMRQNSYDAFDGEFASFIVEELIPKVTSQYKLKISTSPDMHMAAGGSSGGISAWNCVWFRNDYFHRVYMSSPTFSAMTKGFEAPVLMRLYETKAVRGYMDWSENEPNNYFGSSYLAALNAQSALEYAGYDVAFRYNEGEGHCSRQKDEAGLTEVLTYIWKDYKTVPVKAPRNTPYIDKLVSKSSEWKKEDVNMPEGLSAYAAGGIYSFDGGSILFTPEGGKAKEAANGFSRITSLAVSSDGWRLYVADATTATVYAMAIGKDGSLSGKMNFASLYTNTYFTTPGAAQLCVDKDDRLYAVTEMGIQVIKSYGIVAAILEYPDGKIPDAMAFGGSNNRYLYLKFGNKIYSRYMQTEGKKNESSVTKPASRDYYA